MEIHNVDHIKFGNSSRHFVYPKPLPSTEEISTFSSELKEIVRTKLEVLNKRDKEVADSTNALILASSSCKKSEAWFLREYAAAIYEEHFYIYQWQKYWLSILDGLEPKKKSRYSGSQLDIEKAKQFPIEQLYPGRLRQFGNKLTGLCCFHEEKTPSFFIFPNNTYYCFGCNEHGDSIDFTMKIKKYEFSEAVRWMQ